MLGLPMGSEVMASESASRRGRDRRIRGTCLSKAESQRLRYALIDLSIPQFLSIPVWEYENVYVKNEIT